MINFEQHWLTDERMRERLREAAEERLARSGRTAVDLDRSMAARIGAALNRARGAVARRLVGLAGAA